MRFDDAAARLEPLPDVLPPPSAAVTSIVRTDVGWARPGGTASQPGGPASQPGGPASGPGSGSASGSSSGPASGPTWGGATGASRPASVLVLVYPDDAGLARLVLIERTAHDGHHSGEVSFPGGKAEPVDADASATALREAAEEVALDPHAAGVRVVGFLEPIWIPVSDFQVTPVVALASRVPRLSPDPREVARILQPPLTAFLPDAPVDVVERTVRDWSLRFGSYTVDGLTVWGATARVLSQLGAVVAR